MTTPVTPEAVEHVRKAIQVALWDPNLTEDGQTDASSICRVLLELAVDRFGAAGKDKLVSWGISTSEDVGSIVDRLIHDGAISAGSHNTSRDFAGWFDLEQPPESWKLQW